jgi:MoaA/NifB/PqqE/SkfB family radical SAM enzyme
MGHDLMKRLCVIATYRCNMDCRFCLLSDRRGKAVSIELHLLRKLLEQAANLGVEAVGLTGGEVGLHPQFDRLVKEVADHGFRFGIVSNGYDVERYVPLVEYGERFDYISFSLDGAHPAVHDTLRREGSFDRVTRAIRDFSQRGVKTYVQMCLNKFNIGQMRDVAVLAMDLGAGRLRYLSTIPTGKNGEYVLLPEERLDCVRQVIQMREEMDFPLLYSASLRTKPVMHFCSSLDLESMGIHPGGKVVLCCDMSAQGAALGSLEKHGLKSLMKKGTRVSRLLRKKMQLHLRNGTMPAGFDTCLFCNYYLREPIEKEAEKS